MAFLYSPTLNIYSLLLNICSPTANKEFVMLLSIKSSLFSGLISYSSDYKTIHPDENKTRKNPAATQIVFQPGLKYLSNSV